MKIKIGRTLMEKSKMIGKNVAWQSPKHADKSGSGKVMDKILSRDINYYLISDKNLNVLSIPCHWITQIVNYKKV